MRLCTFVRTDAAHNSRKTQNPLTGLPLMTQGQDVHGTVGVALSGDRVLDLEACRLSAHTVFTATEESMAVETGFCRSMQELLNLGPSFFELIRHLVDRVEQFSADHAQSPQVRAFTPALSDVQLMAPVPRPTSIRDCMAFEQHFLQAMRGGARLTVPVAAQLDALTRKVGIPLIRTPALYKKIPAYYKGNPASVIGTGEDVIWPSYTRYLDYELEVGLFLFKRGKSLTQTSALEHIAGYTIFNDFSARETQIEEMKLRLGPAKGKDFDTGNAMGPWLVTPDELGDPGSLACRAYINEALVTDSSTGSMQFSVGEILSYISRDETLYPGDFVGLGTVPNGCGLEHGRFLKPGDRVRLEVSKLGVLENQVVKPNP